MSSNSNTAIVYLLFMGHQYFQILKGHAAVILSPVVTNGPFNSITVKTITA